MMTSSINVIIYSYKGKLLKDAVSSLLSNSSKANHIKVTIVEQHPIKKSDYFLNIPNVDYEHIFWDHQDSPIRYKLEKIQESSEEYTLMISDNTLMNPDWDLDLINFINKNDGIISGIGKPSIFQDDLFYVKQSREFSETFGLGMYIDRSLIFTKTSTLKNIKYPDFLKYNGENDYLSMYYFINGTNIFYAPSTIGSVNGKNSIETLYTPFSINHNYNKIIDIYHGKIKIGIEEKRTIEDFIMLHNIDINNLYRLPFQTNDVDYDCYNNEFDKIDGRKFIGKVNSIY